MSKVYRNENIDNETLTQTTEGQEHRDVFDHRYEELRRVKVRPLIIVGLAARTDCFKHKADNRREGSEENELHGQHLTLQQNGIRQGLVARFGTRMKQAVQAPLYQARTVGYLVVGMGRMHGGTVTPRNENSPVRALQVIRVAHELLDHGAPVPPPEHGDEEAEELVDHVGLVKVLEDPQVRLPARRQDQAQEARHAVHRAHPQDGDDLSLHERLVHTPQVGRHVEHGDQAGEEGEGAGDVHDRQVPLLFDLRRDRVLGGFDLPGGWDATRIISCFGSARRNGRGNESSPQRRRRGLTI